MTTGRQGPLRTTAWLLAASFVVAHLCFAVLPGAFEPWDLKATDLLFRARERLRGDARPYDPVVAYVEIGDRTFDELRTSYVNRSHHAAVIRNLARMGAALQIQDFAFKGSADPERDRLLVEATRSAGNVIFGFIVGLARDRPPARGALRPWRPAVEGDAAAFPSALVAEGGFADLATEARGLGFIDIEPDRDGVFRRTPLLVRATDGFHPSLALQAAADYLGVAPESVVVRPGESIVLRGARRPGGPAADLSIPIDAEGRTRVNFVGPWATMDHYAFARVHDAAADPRELDVWRARLEGRIVVVADASTAAKDVGTTPLEAGTPLAQIHANVLHSIVSGRFVREASPWAMLPIEILLLAVLGVLARRDSARLLVAGTAGLVVLFFGGAFLVFLRSGLILHLVRPMMMAALGFAALLGHRYLMDERQRAALRGSFEAYFPPSLVRRLLLRPDRVAVGGERKELTVLFSDIRGFTSRTASADPDDVQRLLNEYFEAMVDVAFRHGGTVDKFIGDGLMVFFGDPEPQPDHALRGVRTGIEMQRRIGELNRAWAARGIAPIEVRIGINTGPMVVGNMGSSKRLSYTVIGAEVNLCQRLEANAPPGGILISHATRMAIGDLVPTRPSEPVRAKGLPDPVVAHLVVLDGPSTEEARG